MLKFQFVFQAHEKRFAKESARGCYRQKVGFVHDKYVFVPIKNRFLEWYGGLIFEFAIVIDACAGAEGTKWRKLLSGFVNEFTFRHSGYPYRGCDMRKSVGEEFEQGRPVARGKPLGRRGNAVDRWKDHRASNLVEVERWGK